MKSKAILYVVLTPLGILILLCVTGIFYSHLYRYLHRDDWKVKTTPLSKETVDKLCLNFKLEKDHSLCNGQKDIYGPDFYEIIRDTFRPSNGYGIEGNIPATYDEIEKRIGSFKVECEPITYVKSWDREYFACTYDLRGDGQFLIGAMYYYPEMTVFRINTPMGNDSE